ncbi:uncharacterized protein [Ptychodera flava]|uniref:uncharacterized protein n=1 Tax=Ptychodera flava TaxID=63121 RepID=UPI00396A34DF
MVRAILIASILCQAFPYSSTVHRRSSDDAPLIGVTTNNKLMTRNYGYDEWKSVQRSCCVTSIAVMEDGSMIGIGNDQYLYTKRSVSSGSWTGRIANSCCIKDVAVMPDSRILAVTLDNALVVRSSLRDDWRNVKKSGGVKRIDVFPDGRILGVTASGSLRVRNRVGGRWADFEGRQFTAADVSIQPDGTILAISKDNCGLYALRNTRGKWFELSSIGQSRCFVDIVSPGNLAIRTAYSHFFGWK